LKKPSLRLAIEINKRVRDKDEWFEEPDDLERVSRALSSVDREEHPVVAAGILAYRVTRAQGFAEGNKRTALLLARWILDNNGVDGNMVLPTDDLVLADLLIQAASGADVESDIIARLQERI
jgi:prophage maintenance system killer protein